MQKIEYIFIHVQIRIYFCLRHTWVHIFFENPNNLTFKTLNIPRTNFSCVSPTRDKEIRLIPSRKKKILENSTQSLTLFDVSEKSAIRYEN